MLIMLISFHIYVQFVLYYPYWQRICTYIYTFIILITNTYVYTHTLTDLLVHLNSHSCPLSYIYTYRHIYIYLLLHKFSYTYSYQNSTHILAYTHLSTSAYLNIYSHVISYVAKQICNLPFLLL